MFSICVSFFFSYAAIFKWVCLTQPRGHLQPAMPPKWKAKARVTKKAAEVRRFFDWWLGNHFWVPKTVPFLVSLAKSSPVAMKVWNTTYRMTWSNCWTYFCANPHIRMGRVYKLGGPWALLLRGILKCYSCEGLTGQMPPRFRCALGHATPMWIVWTVRLGRMISPDFCYFPMISKCCSGFITTSIALSIRTNALSVS